MVVVFHILIKHMNSLNDLNFGSGYRGGSVAIGVTDQAYEHRFVSSGIGSIKKTAFSGAASQAFTATDAQYILILVI